MKFQPKKKHEEENPEPYTGLFVSAASATLAGIVGLSLGFAGGAMKEHTEEREAIERKLSNINSRIISESELAFSKKEINDHFKRGMDDLQKEILAAETALREQEEKEEIKDKQILDIMKKTKSISDRVNRVIESSEPSNERKLTEINAILQHQFEEIGEIFQRMKIREAGIGV